MNHQKGSEHKRLVANVYNQADKYANDVVNRYSFEGKRYQDLRNMLGRDNVQDNDSEEMLDLIVKAREESVKKYEQSNKFFFEGEDVSNNNLVKIAIAFGECLNHESSLFGYKLHVLTERCILAQKKYDRERREVLFISKYVDGIDDNPTGLHLIDDIYKLELENMITKELGAVLSCQDPWEACHKHLIEGIHYLKIAYADQINRDLSLSVSQKEIDKRNQNYDSIKSRLCRSLYTLQGFRLRYYEISTIDQLRKNDNTD